MKSLTEHLWFETPHRRDYLNITDTVAQLVRKSGVQEGLCLVNAMHITASAAQNAPCDSSKPKDVATGEKNKSKYKLPLGDNGR